MWLISSVSQLAAPLSCEQQRRFSMFIHEAPLSGVADGGLQAASLQLLQVFVEQAPTEAAAIVLRNPLASPQPTNLLQFPTLSPKAENAYASIL